MSSRAPNGASNAGANLAAIGSDRLAVRPSIDLTIVQRVHQQVADQLQAEQTDRRRRGDDRLEGPAERQYVRFLLARAIRDLAADRINAGLEPLRVDEQVDEEAELFGAVQARMYGAGRLQSLLDDVTVQDVFINGADNVFVIRTDGEKERVAPVAESDDELVQMVSTLGAYAGISSRAWDPANPRILLRLPGGARLSGVLGVTARPSVSIRRHSAEAWTLAEHVSVGSISAEVADFLARAVAARLNIVFAGATGSGKTSLLRSATAEFATWERVVTVEAAFELGLDRFPDRHPDCVALEERLPNSEGSGAVTLAECLRTTLHMKPDRIVLGEVLGPEVVTMLNAMTQGNDGALSTIHARSATDVFARIATYAVQAAERLPREATHQLIASGIDLVVYLEQDPRSKRRRVREIVEVNGFDNGAVLSSRLFDVPSDGVGDPAAVASWTGVVPQRFDRLSVVGWVPPHAAEGTSYGGWSR
ncbi:ATPase, T2SS/T4P/T4SS family [Nocardioides zeae]|uniref:ATPase, T2SS/T4P/T4SS family n=1 Tax=Nocardioides imazamoxiresistens TaxID=3231893 RepID=A0ABU3Q082_9ACTN|nr:ATPase, T2SS/T4P/T4SS family [Nocardioides zeae]MDT9594880.1 ATPase, T2SS/T4P/T4SS family [Nocardioides zeae]